MEWIFMGSYMIIFCFNVVEFGTLRPTVTQLNKQVLYCDYVNIFENYI